MLSAEAPDTLFVGIPLFFLKHNQLAIIEQSYRIVDVHIQQIQVSSMGDAARVAADWL
jgi:hypothetical protein